MHNSTPETLGEAYSWAIAELQAAGVDTPQRDARMLLASCAGIETTSILTNPERAVASGAVDVFTAAIARRALRREPVSRILGRRGFYGLDLEVTRATLDPRPETETVIEAAKGLAAKRVWASGDPSHILDIGTGTGALIIALLTIFPGAQGVAVDIDADALATARRNAERIGVAPRLTLGQASWGAGITGRFDLVVSNPPYIPTADIARLDPEVASFDPHLALDGGQDGLEAYRALIPRAAGLLAPDGWLLLEIGAGQENDVAAIVNGGLFLTRAGSRARWRDLGGIVRCLGFSRTA